MSRGAKRRADEIEGLSGNTTQFSRRTQPTQSTISDNTGSSITIFRPPPKPVSPPSHPQPPQTSASADLEGQTEPPAGSPDPRAQMLGDFADHFEEIAGILLEREAHPNTNMPCPCGRSNQLANTTCHDCIAYTPACADCFVDAHSRNPFHWAEVWDERRGYFVRYDISKLAVVRPSHPEQSGFVYQLGHGGAACPSPDAERLFTIMDINGIHSTRIAYCGCREQPPNKVRQLLRAGLFPASIRDPLTAFTISVLKQFALHNLVSKKAAYDYVKAVQHLSDNAFAADVPDPYAAFLRTVRVYNYITAVKRAGQLHGIDQVVPHRPPGNVIVWCPACPQPGFNGDPNLTSTPKDLRHLNQLQQTLDGNFQCGQYTKNTDGGDVSQFEDRAYSPEDAGYSAYLSRIPVSKEKSTCTYLTVVNKQDKKKFKNMAVTGTVNCQCSHVFIVSSVDMHHGERFANADMALARALRMWASRDRSASFQTALRVEIDDVDQVRTYDIACEYIIHLRDRFAEHFPDLVDLVERIRWGIPALHVQGHQDSCTYRFGTAYMECVGHFHGESAEQYWPEANQLGPQVRQMNTGYRQELLILHHSYWNWLKTVGLPSTLSSDLALAWTNYSEKRAHLLGLSLSFKEYLTEWRSLSRSWSMVGKELTSPYKHNSGRVPSQQAIFQKLIDDDNNFARTPVSKGVVANFIDTAVKIQAEQRQIAALIVDREEHDLESRKKEIANRTSKLQTRISTWRKIQMEIMPQVGDLVAEQTKALPPAHQEKLFLPSDLSADQRLSVGGLDDLAAEEGRWREGEIFDIIRALQNNVKALSALRGDKMKNARHQKANTRSVNQIREGQRRQEILKSGYNQARGADVALKGSSRFPVLTDADLYMKPVLDKRRVGDSKLSDGALWTALAPGRLEEIDDPMDVDTDVGSTSDIGTQMDRRASKPRPRTGKTTTDPVSRRTEAQMKRESGWIWQMGKLTKMNDAEMDAWSREGDRVQCWVPVCVFVQ
ncbi:CxC2 domain-containing protein [Mycena kentingensis (nom. inval.)]|nr:CxC2 domain-containing protein [Mycena kentingensis (nom. inval.)]